jgi:hypothetical protein
MHEGSFLRSHESQGLIYAFGSLASCMLFFYSAKQTSSIISQGVSSSLTLHEPQRRVANIDRYGGNRWTASSSQHDVTRH